MLARSRLRAGVFFVHEFEQGRYVEYLGITLSRSLQQQANKTFSKSGKIGFAAKKVALVIALRPVQAPGPVLRRRDNP